MKKLLLGLALFLGLTLNASAQNISGPQTGTFSTSSSQIVWAQQFQGYQGTGHASNLYVAGTFGSGTITVLASPDFGTTWIAIPSMTCTANCILTINYVNWTGLKLTLSGATNPSLTWWLY